MCFRLAGGVSDELLLFVNPQHAFTCLSPGDL